MANQLDWNGEGDNIRIFDLDTSNMSLEDLRMEWTLLYKTHLPALARLHHPTQRHWPVKLDHCFARIVLDNALGNGEKPWSSIVRAPAIKHMTISQLRKVMALGQNIANGRADLVELDESSLKVRGKATKKRKAERNDREEEPWKRRNLETSMELPPPKLASTCTYQGHEGWDTEENLPPFSSPSTLPQDASEDNKDHDFRLLTSQIRHSGPASIQGDGARSLEDQKQCNDDNTMPAETKPATEADSFTHEDMISILSTAQDLTPLRRRVLTLLTQVPRGRYTTYGALATYISMHPHLHPPPSPSPSRQGSHKPMAKPSARSIGQAMRNNPFAPRVPCHRVLAADGSIGGFGGEWGDKGRHADEKRRLLRGEGVGFDAKGRAVGGPWRGFAD